MMPRLARLWALLCLALAFQVATAHHLRLTARQDNNDPAPTNDSNEPEDEPEPTATETRGNSDDENDEGDGTRTGSAQPSKTDDPKKSASDKDDVDEKATTTFASDATKTTGVVVTTTDGSDNSTYYDDDIPEGQLPLRPKLTPGWGVAGTIMILTGLLYALVGIKNQYIHTFLSTAYLVSLGVAVLIVYVMSVPVSDALQGGYVAAIALSGSALGVASIFFKELTEGLGCALGGFCVSMWLLCLVPGGLLKPVPSKAIFISAFTLVAFAFYFSRYTRDWALITMISFAGGTVAVLGIDCFSRAGLKEFWAYIWELNKDLFPLGADTYPVTKGIRVETAAIVIIFLFGIISQIKLWRIVRDKREQRANERAEDQRNLEEEEVNVGRQVEEENARDRREWERVYGDGEIGSSSASRTSGSEKKLRDSYAPRSEVEVIELTDMSDTDREQRAPAPLTEKDQDGKVTVRVAADDIPEGVTPEEGEDGHGKQPSTAANAEPTIRVVSAEKRRQSQRTSVSEAPEVVPLPFTVPQEDDANSQGDRSSIATFADEGDDQLDRRGSLARRLSRGSTKLLRNLSARSSHVQSPTSPAFGESSEELVIPRGERKDDESSVAATLDGQSIDGSDRQSILASNQSPNIEITATFAGSDGQPEQVQSTGSTLMQDGKRNSTEPTQTSAAAAQLAPHSEAGQLSSSASRSRAGDAAVSVHGQSEKPRSVSSGVSSPASLTKERLPQSLSRVALSYRTNEWAKHLSYADAPEPDQLQIAPEQKPAKSTSRKESPVPVNVEDLQPRTEIGAPPPAITRSDSKLSMSLAKPTASRRDSKTSMSPTSPTGPVTDVVDREQTFSPPQAQSTNAGMIRSSSSSALRRTSATFEPIAEERDARNNPTSIPEEMDDTKSVASVANSTKPPVPGIVSYSSPQTLLGQREMFLRSKSQGNLLAHTSVSHSPDPYTSMTRPPSEAGSLANYPIYASALATDPDDIPLSQRKQMMHRHNSMMSLSGHQPNIRHSSSGLDLSEGTSFNSHQPKRTSTLPTQAARNAQLAQFRNSVAADLQAGMPMMASGRETPFASTTNLLGGREAEVQRNIQIQRNMMISQKEAEAQRKEMGRREKEWTDRVFDERMRSGELMDAHREAMKKMQQGAKGK